MTIKNAGNGSGITPDFRIYNSAVQSISHNLNTKVVWDTTVFDDSGGVDLANNRFTPSVTGKYLIIGSLQYALGVNTKYTDLSIYKNGTLYTTNRAMFSSVTPVGLEVISIVDMNGTTDYIELFTYHNMGVATNTVSASAWTYLTGHLISLKYVI